eukprot:SAG22_NODE_1186_length_5219_cov_345.307227_4_plen_103_part_00
MSNYNNALSTISKLRRKNADFRSYVEQAAADPEMGGGDLETLLIRPIQRIPRYEMLLSELLKNTPDGHSDKPSVAAALKSVRACVRCPGVTRTWDIILAEIY